MNPTLLTHTRSLLARPLLAILLLSVACPLHAATETNIITPQQIVSNTLAHSYQLRLSDKDLLIARSQTDQARAQGLPHFDATGQVGRYVGLQSTTLGPIEFPSVENRYAASIGVRQPAYTGGRITSQKQSAAFQLRAANALRKGTEANITLQALSAYWRWSKAYYVLGSLRDAVARTQSHSVDIHNQQEAGLATENDVLSTDVLLEQTRLRLQLAQRQLELARADIAFLTGQELPPHDIPQRATADQATIPQEAALLGTATQNRPERTASEMQAKASEALIKTARSDLFPQLSLVARYEGAQPNYLNIPPRNRWDNDGYAGLALTWNVFDFGLTRARVAEATARADQARLRQRLVDDQITLQVRQARINLQDAVDRLALAQQTQRSASRNLDSATDLWRNGLSRHSDVLDALAQLTNSQFDVVAANADIVLAQAELEHATGLLTAPKR